MKIKKYQNGSKVQEFVINKIKNTLKDEDKTQRILDFARNHPKLVNWVMPEIRRRLYDYVDPYGYDDFGSRINTALSGNQGEYPMHLHGRDDIFAEYLGIPKDKRHNYEDSIKVIPSKYRPTKGDDPNSNYKALDIDDSTKFNLIFDALYDGRTNKLSRNNSSLTDLLSTHTIGTGFDDKGQYVSYYDLWDINPKVGESAVDLNNSPEEKTINKIIGNNKKDVSLGIGKPVEFYDRIYLNDYFNVTPEVEKNAYYGGYIRPAFLEDSRKYNSPITGDEYYQSEGSIPIVKNLR